MISLRILSLAAVLSASVSVAQDLTHMIGSLSGSCQAAAGGLVTSDFSTCANIMGLIPVIGAPASILSPFADWVNSTCPIEPCSNSTVATALSTIEKGCADDLAKGVQTAIALSTIVSNYVPIRQMICAQSTTNNNFCTTTLFSNIEKATKKSVTIDVLESILIDGFSTLVPLLAATPKEEICDACAKELYITVSSLKPSQYSTNKTKTPPMNTDDLVSAECGASFVDKQHPSDVRQAGAANATTTNNSTGPATGAHNGDHASANAPTSSAVFLQPSYVALLSLFLLAYLNVAA